MTQHDVSCGRRLRERLLAEAGTNTPSAELLHAIAERIRAHCGHGGLKAHRIAFGYTIASAVEAAHRLSERHKLPARGLVERSWVEWESGGRPDRDYQDLLCRLFHTGPMALGFANDYSTTTHPQEPGVVELVAQAAAESTTHAQAMASVDDDAVRQLDVRIVRLAREYVHSEPLPLLRDLLTGRDEVFRLLRTRRRPSDDRHLILLAGLVCGLIANAALDAGAGREAVAYARSAWTYATLADHAGLRSWLRGLQAMIAYWSGDAQAALGLTRDGRLHAPGPTARARLFAIEGLAQSALGSGRDGLRALTIASDELATSGGGDVLHDGVGGEFGFGQAKRAYLSAAANLHLGRPSPVIHDAREAIALYQTGPTEDRAYGNETLAQADLARAHLMHDELDAACAVLGGVLDLPVEKRIDAVDQRLTAIGNVLRSARYRNAADSVRVVQRIESITPATSAVAGWAR